MCFGIGRRPSPPASSALPKPEPADSAIEETADQVVIAKKRSSIPASEKKLGTMIGRRRLGTRSLQIPLLPNSIASGNLNYK
tara:strand:- start:388 stop:633 length:246 start_codon:yes stop_codon:yes gene_type:complete